MQRQRERPLRAHPVRLDPRLVPGRAQLVVQPARRAPLGVRAGAALLEAAEAAAVVGAAVTGSGDHPMPGSLCRRDRRHRPRLRRPRAPGRADRRGRLSSRELTEAYLERIARLDPMLNAFRVVLAERALAEAAQADGRRGSGDRRRCSACRRDQGRHRRRGRGRPRAARTRSATRPTEDAEVVRRLRAAGAVIVGKTSVPELEITPFTETPTFGATRNPWDLNRTPGGSSGGSASAVAAGLAGGALGSDGGGSIRIPAGCCGLFGLKTQRGRISLAPKDEAWHGLSVFGPIVRHVADAALFIDATERRRAARARGRRGRPGACGSLSRPSCRRPILGGPDAEQRGALDAAAELLRGLGHEVFERDPDYGATGPAFTARYFRGIHDEGRAMAHPSAFAAHARLHAPRRRDRAAGARAGTSRRRGCRAALRRLSSRPTSCSRRCSRAARPDRHLRGPRRAVVLQRLSRWVPYCAAFNHTGQPRPRSGRLHPRRLPARVQLVGRPDDEATLLSLARADRAGAPVGRPAAGLST